MTLATETYPSGRVVTTAYDDAGSPKYLKGAEWIGSNVLCRESEQFDSICVARGDQFDDDGQRDTGIADIQQPIAADGDSGREPADYSELLSDERRSDELRFIAGTRQITATCKGRGLRAAGNPGYRTTRMTR